MVVLFINLSFSILVLGLENQIYLLFDKAQDEHDEQRESNKRLKSLETDATYVLGEI
jgi:hypothetical protein